MHTVFLDGANRVVAAEQERDKHTTMTLAQAQARVSSCALRIAGAPDGLKAASDYSESHHEKADGDGTQLIDYNLILTDKTLELKDFIATNGMDHRQVNYRTGLISSLHRHIDFNDPTSWKRGEYRKVEFYADTQRTKLVIKSEMTYKRQPNGMLTRVRDDAEWADPDYFGRRCIRTWYRKDGTAHPVTKITFKTYNLEEAMEEGERRRTNVKRRLKTDVLSMLVATRAVNPAEPTPQEIAAAEADGRTFLQTYRNELSDYIESGDLDFKVPPAVPNITDDTSAWLSNDVTPYGWTGPTIRDEILNSLKEIME